MKITVEETSSVERKLNIEVPWDQYQEEVNRQLLRIRKSATLKGFRKGKAPMEMVRRIYSDDAGKDAVNNLATEAVKSTLAEHDLTPFGNPYLTDVRTEENESVTMEAMVELEPVFDLADYSALKLERPVPEVTREDIDGFLQNMRERHGETVTVEDGRGLRDEDIATLDFVGTRGGEPVENLDVKDYMVRIGRSEMVPGFEEQIVGMTPGQVREFDLTFPEDFVNEDLAGSMIHFTVTLKEIRELRLPDLDDEFARSVGKFDTLAELEDTIREDILRMRDSESDKELRSNLIRRLVEDNMFDVPASLVDRELRRLVQDYGENMLRSGVPNEKVREMIMDNEGHLKTLAEEQIRLFYIINEIAGKEEMKAGEEEIRRAVEDTAARSGQDADDLIQEYAENGTLTEISYNIVREKVFERILETAEVTEVKAAEPEVDPPEPEKKPKAKKKSKRGK